MIRCLGEAELALVGATALAMDFDELLDRSYVAVLVGIAGRARVAHSVADSAAEVLVGIAASRPFPRSNRAAAWLGAAHLLSIKGVVVDLTDDAVMK